MNKFSDGSSSAYVELPVPAAYLNWTRGNAQLRAVASADPGLFFGGWRAFVKSNRDNVELPSIPIPTVTRVSEDGKHEYQVYATNVLNFLPIQHRTRFELRERTKDQETGKEYDKVVAISKDRKPGYAPYRQVFGLVFDPKSDTHAPGVIKVFKWSAFITFEKAGQAWNKIQVPEGKVLIRRYGTIGKDGMPKFETVGQGKSTPIEAVGLDKPRFYDLTPELDELFDVTVNWRNCPRWNAEGEVEEEPMTSAKKEFLAKCLELQFTNIEIEQLLEENGKDYAKALLALNPPTDDEINAALAEGDDPFS